jgi:hypothetical protein
MFGSRPTGLLGLGALALLSACGSGPATVTGTPSLTAYRSCLEQHGAPFPTAAASQTAAAAATVYKRAHKACRPLRPAEGIRSTGFRSQTRKRFGTCMALHGVPLPTPTARPIGRPEPSATPGERRGGMLDGLDRKDPKVRSAMDACGYLLMPSATPSSAKNSGVAK